MKAKTIFVTVQMEGAYKLLDYPQNVPIPRIGEVIIYNNHSGVVSSVHHVVTDDMIEIRLDVTKQPKP